MQNSFKVTIGGVTATTQAVEAATTVSADFTQDVDVDGFVGLALSTLNMVTPNRQYTFFDNVKSSLAQPLFAAWLRKGAPGVYDFGFTDSTKYSGTIGYVPVNVTYGEWQFATGVYSVGSTNYASLGDAFADSGTSLIALPDPAVANYYKAVSGAVYDTGSAAYLFPCTATLPSFSLTIGGVKRTVPGSLLNYATYGSGYCYGGIQSNQNYGLAILGMLLRAVQMSCLWLSTDRLLISYRRRLLQEPVRCFPKHGYAKYRVRTSEMSNTRPTDKTSLVAPSRHPPSSHSCR